MKSKILEFIENNTDSWEEREWRISVTWTIHARMGYNEANRADGQRRYDVGVDANNFFPVSTRQIVSFFEAYRRSEDC